MSARLRPEFVTTIPETIEPGVVYVSMTYATVIHLCACGCGYEAVTPLSPTDWQLTYDGVEVTLSPSVGNWSFPCRSHYLVRSGRIVWAAAWDDDEIAAGRARDVRRKSASYRQTGRSDDTGSIPLTPREQSAKPWWRRLLGR